MKSVRIQSFSSLYFATFGLTAERLNSINSFVLKPTTRYGIQKLLSQLYNEKTLGSASIPVISFKCTVDILSKPLSLIIKKSFAEDIFNDTLKIAPVRATHKKIYLNIWKTKCVVESIIFFA